MLEPKLLNWCFWCRNIPKVEIQETQNTTNDPSLCVCLLQHGLTTSEPQAACSRVCQVHCTIDWERHKVLHEDFLSTEPAMVPLRNPAVLCAFAWLNVLFQERCTSGEKWAHKLGERTDQVTYQEVALTGAAREHGGNRRHVFSMLAWLSQLSVLVAELTAHLFLIPVV